MTYRRFAVLIAALTLTACGGNDIEIPQAAVLEAVAESDNQLGAAGDRLARPLAVRAYASDGVTPVPRAEVAWEVMDGEGATLSDTRTVADGLGEAHVSLRLGPEEGTYRVRGSLVERPSEAVTLMAVATTPPRLASVQPTTFAGGDTITLTGTGLDAAVTVEVGNAAARIVGSSVTKAVLSVEVPPCLVPGPVTVTARIGLSASELSATYEANVAPLQLQVGDHLSVDPVALDGCATFPPAGPEGADYLLAPQSVTDAPGLTVSYRLKGDAVATVVTGPEPPAADRPHALAFHDFLRDRETALGNEPRLPYAPDPVLGISRATIEVGDTRSFKVCSIVTCSAVEDFETVTAEVQYVGEHAVIYLDRDAPTGLTGTDIASLGTLFDSDLYEVGTRAFGAESDVDRNGRVFILMTPIVNQLTPVDQCATSFITGFFFSLDTDPAREQDSRSNQAEVFYAIVPDPEGTVTCDHSVDRVRRIVPITFIHEFQHLISFYQHVVLRDGGSEDTWLNESMSHLSEELAAQHFRARGDSVRFSAFALGDLFNAFEYLSSPEAHFPLYSQGTGTLEERGAGWLFLRWLSDQFGPEISRRLAETDLTGTANVAAAAGESTVSLLSDWFLANYVSHLPDFDAPPRLQYTTWDLRAVYASLHEQAPSQFDRPFPIVPWFFSGGTFDITGTLRSGSGTYVRVQHSSGFGGFTVTLEGSGGEPLAGPAVPRLNIIRLR